MSINIGPIGTNYNQYPVDNSGSDNSGSSSSISELFTKTLYVEGSPANGSNPTIENNQDSNSLYNNFPECEPLHVATPSDERNDLIFDSNSTSQENVKGQSGDDLILQIDDSTNEPLFTLIDDSPTSKEKSNQIPDSDPTNTEERSLPIRFLNGVCKRILGVCKRIQSFFQIVFEYIKCIFLEKPYKPTD